MLLQVRAQPVTHAVLTAQKSKSEQDKSEQDIAMDDTRLPADAALRFGKGAEHDTARGCSSSLSALAVPSSSSSCGSAATDASFSVLKFSSAEAFCRDAALREQGRAGARTRCLTAVGRSSCAEGVRTAKDWLRERGAFSSRASASVPLVALRGAGQRSAADARGIL